MCKYTALSKYQKSAVKFVTNFLGTDIPFTYQKNQSNHLEVRIDGVAKPIYTSSTPSDGNTLANFKARVKREVGNRQTDSAYKRQVSQQVAGKSQRIPMDIHVLSSHAFYEKILQTCIKQYRTQLSTMAADELKQVLADDSVGGLHTRRKKHVTISVSAALSRRKNRPHIPAKERKALETKLLEHVNFMLPSLAAYSEQLTQKNAPSIPLPINVTSQPSNPKPSISKPSTPKASTPKASTPKAQPSGHPQEESTALDNDHALSDTNTSQGPMKAEQKDHNRPESTEHQVFAEQPETPVASMASGLMAMKSAKRIRALRALSYDQMTQLMADIQQATTLNRAQDLDEVVTLMQAKGVSLEALTARLSD